MTYEEITSSRSNTTRKEEVNLDDEISPDRDSIESIEPLQEKDIKATGPDPYEKLNYKSGENGNDPNNCADLLLDILIHEETQWRFNA